MTDELSSAGANGKSAVANRWASEGKDVSVRIDVGDAHFSQEARVLFTSAARLAVGGLLEMRRKARMPAFEVSEIVLTSDVDKETAAIAPEILPPEPATASAGKHRTHGRTVTRKADFSEVVILINQASGWNRAEPLVAWLDDLAVVAHEAGHGMFSRARHAAGGGAYPDEPGGLPAIVAWDEYRCQLMADKILVEVTPSLPLRVKDSGVHVALWHLWYQGQPIPAPVKAVHQFLVSRLRGTDVLGKIDPGRATEFYRAGTELMYYLAAVQGAADGSHVDLRSSPELRDAESSQDYIYQAWESFIAIARSKQLLARGPALIRQESVIASAAGKFMSRLLMVCSQRSRLGRRRPAS